jgi:Type II secretion system (T2SS), protein M subtype b
MNGAGRTASRAAALAVLLLLSALVLFGLVAPYRDYLRSLAARNEAAAALVERYRDLAARGAAPAAADDALDGLLLGDLSDAQAIARLQRMVQGFATAQGLEIGGLQALPRDDGEALQRLTLRLRGSGGIAAVNAFLHAAETARPLLVVDNLRLQSRQARGDARLELQLDVSAFRARPAT